MIEIRRARLADAEALARMSAEVQTLHAEALPHLFKPPGPQTFPAAAVRALLKDPEWIMLVATDGDEPVGYASAQLQRRADTPFRHPAELLCVHWMGVLAQRRRQGVGRALIDAMRAEAASRGVSTVTIDVWEFNAEARAFYEKVGFRPQRHILSMDVDERTPSSRARA